MPEPALVAFTSSHVPARVDWLNHPAVRAGLPITGPITRESTITWAQRVAAATDRADFVLEAEGRPVVMCGVTHMDEPSARGELYMFADPNVHRRGYGSIALECLCKWAFDERGLNRLFLFTLGENAGARRFYERVGFQQEGRLREHQWHEGRLVDRYIHGLLAQDWRGQTHG